MNDGDGTVALGIHLYVHTHVIQALDATVILQQLPLSFMGAQMLANLGYQCQNNSELVRIS